jgi:hypothetical protein
MEAAILKDLMKNVGKMDLPKGEPQAIGIEVQEVEAIPLEDGKDQADPWPIVKEKLAAVKSQVDELEALISQSYYPGEEKGEGNPGPKEMEY